MEKSDGKQEMKKSMDSGGVMSANGLNHTSKILQINKHMYLILVLS
jgi:hypothetical protein